MTAEDVELGCLESRAYCLALSHLGRRGTGVHKGGLQAGALLLRARGDGRPLMILCDLDALVGEEDENFALG